jgi:hypothetical protein
MIREHPITRARPTAYGPFEVRAEIATGPSGSVYFATDPEHATVSVHTIDVPAHSRRRDADIINTLRALCATKLRHPNIARALASGIEDGTPYIVYPHVSGLTLAGAAQQRGTQSVDDVVRLLKPVAAAIDAAAAAGVHHGALSPFDIMVDGDAVTVTRFGLVDALRHAGLTVAVQPHYSSRQRVASAPPALADDVYSLAAIALALIVGESVDASDRGNIKSRGGRALLTTPLASTEETILRGLEGVDARLLRIALSRALSENPAVRHPHAADFITELQRSVLRVVRPSPLQIDRPPTVSPDDAPAVMMFASENDRGRSALETSEVALPLSIPAPVPHPVPAPTPVSAQLRVPLRSSVPARTPPIALMPYDPAYESSRRRLLVAGFVVAAIGIAGIAYGVLSNGSFARFTSATIQKAAPAESATPAPQGPPPREPAPALAPVTPPPVAVSPPPAAPTVPTLEQLSATQPSGSQETKSNAVASAPSAPPPPNGPGSLFVTTYPVGARLYVDGSLVGTAPLLMPGLTSGPHTVRLELEGMQTWSSSVEIKSSERFRLAVKLEP